MDDQFQKPDKEIEGSKDVPSLSTGAMRSRDHTFYTQLENHQEVPLGLNKEFRTKEGKLIEMSLVEHHEDFDFSMGWKEVEILASVEGEALGFIRVRYLSEENFNEATPDIWHYIAGRDSKFLGIQDCTPDTLFQALRQYGYGDASFDAADKKEYMESYAERYQESYSEIQDFQVGRGTVQWVDVKEAHRGEGIVFPLYEAAGRWLGEQGLTLFKGGSECDEKVSHIWRLMDERDSFPLQYGKMWSASKADLPYLDYR